MRVKTTSIALAVALAGATGFALAHDDVAVANASRSAAPVQVATPLEPDDDWSDEALPPGHPDVGSGGTTGVDDAIKPTDLAAALTWEVPATWTSQPNPSAMRLATHKVPRAGRDAEDGELSISRAGGDVEANIDRWAGQFEGAARQTRREETVRDFTITVVQIEGTYEGGMGAAAGTHPGWALIGAIVATPEQPYFFKLTGPATTVRAAHAGFEALLGSIAAVGP